MTEHVRCYLCDRTAVSRAGHRKPAFCAVCLKRYAEPDEVAQPAAAPVVAIDPELIGGYDPFEFRGMKAWLPT